MQTKTTTRFTPIGTRVRLRYDCGFPSEGTLVDNDHYNAWVKLDDERYPIPVDHENAILVEEK